MFAVVQFSNIQNMLSIFLLPIKRRRIFSSDVLHRQHLFRWHGRNSGLCDIMSETQVTTPFCQSNQLNVTDILESLTGSFGAIWNRMELDLDSTAAYQIIIEANIGDGSLGDIAIDDVSFTPGCQFFT